MAIYKVAGIGEYHKFFDDNSYVDCIRYITRGTNYVGGYNVPSIPFAPATMEGTALKFGKLWGKRIRHSILSFSRNECTDPDVVFKAAAEIAKFYKEQYEIVYAVHTNTDNLHIHFVMNMVSFTTGYKYRGKKKDLYDFMGAIARITGCRVYREK